MARSPGLKVRHRKRDNLTALIQTKPIKQSFSDGYSSLDRGLFDGIAVAFDMVYITKLYEVLNYHIIYKGDSLGFTPVTHVMIRAKFESLPPKRS